jgi:hypothetical protein
MNWNKASAVGEILSSIAILATLVYLGIEIQQNADATEAETRQAMLASDQQFLQMFVDNPELHLNWYKPNLTDEEKTQLSYFLVTHFRMRENNWFQYRNGILDDATWRSYSASIPALLSSPRTRRWWTNFGAKGDLFHADFRATVNELLTDAPIFDVPRHTTTFD